MYNKDKFMKALKGVLELIPDDISPEGVAKREQLKKDLNKLEEKENKKSTQEEKN